MEIYGLIQQYIDKDQCHLSFSMIFLPAFWKDMCQPQILHRISHPRQPQRWRYLSCSHQYSQRSLDNHPHDKMRTNWCRLNLRVKRYLQTEVFHQKNPLESSTARYILLVETMVLRTAEAGGFLVATCLLLQRSCIKGFGSTV